MAPATGCTAHYQHEQAMMRYSSERSATNWTDSLTKCSGYMPHMDWATWLSILGFGAAIIPSIAGIISALQSRSTPFIYTPTLGKPITLPAPTLKSSLPVTPSLPAPAPAPDPYAQIRLAIRKELEADQKRAFWPNLWVNLAISGFFYLVGVVTTVVVTGH